jgi:hypothetical protein
MNTKTVLRPTMIDSCCGLFAAATGNAEAPPSSAPLLRITAPMHTAVIRRIDMDTAETWVVSASHDKSVRLVSGDEVWVE